MSKTADTLDAKIKNLEKKLGNNKKSQQKPKDDSDSDGLNGFIDMSGESDSETQKESQFPPSKKVKTCSNNYDAPENNKHVQGHVQPNIELTFVDVEFVIKRLNPAKHFFPFLEKLKNATQKSKEKVIKELCADLFVGSDKMNRDVLVKIILIGIAKTHFLKNIHFFYEEFAKNQINQSCSFLHQIICYFFTLRILDIQFFEDFIKLEIANHKIEHLHQILTLTGKLIRKEKPKLILEIEQILKQIVPLTPSIEILLNLVKKIRNNHDIETTLVENFGKFQKASKGLISESEKESVVVPLQAILVPDFAGQMNWIDQYVKSAEVEIQDNKHSELLQKYEGITSKLGLTHFNEKLIVSFVLDSGNFLEAAEKIHKMRVFHKNYQDIPRSIFILLNSEPEFNPYYLFLTQKLLELIDDLKYAFYRFIWNYYNHLEDGFDQRLCSFIIKMTVGCFKLGCFDFKILKNFDFAAISKEQKLFNRNLFKFIVVDLDFQFVNQQIAKNLVSDKKLLFADEIQGFARKYEKLYFEKDFPEVAKKNKAREILDAFKNIK